MDRIIVKTTADMQRVIDWSAKLTGMATELPFPEGEIEFVEELILLKFRDEGQSVVAFELWIHRDAETEYACTCDFRYDFSADKTVELHIHGRPEAKPTLAMLLMSDDTVGKCVRKFRAIMLFAVYYREDIERTKKTERIVRQRKKSKGNGKRSNKRPLTVRRYTIGGELLSELPAPKRVWHGYNESFGVRGHYRTYKSGKTVWVRPYTKKGKAEKLSDREYIL